MVGQVSRLSIRKMTGKVPGPLGNPRIWEIASLRSQANASDTCVVSLTHLAPTGNSAAVLFAIISTFKSCWIFRGKRREGCEGPNIGQSV